jgi:hypothetical protein
VSDDETEKLFDQALGEIAREYMKKKKAGERTVRADRRLYRVVSVRPEDKRDG